MKKLKILDLYCGGGGAGHGYMLAGFDVTGVDLFPQPKHKGKFIQSDAIEYLKANFNEYDVLHASPPCQAYSMSSMQFRKAKNGEFIQYVGHFSGVKEVQEMTGLFWLGQKELAQSIPPQYTKFIGEQIIKQIVK